MQRPMEGLQLENGYDLLHMRKRETMIYNTVQLVNGPLVLFYLHFQN